MLIINFFLYDTKLQNCRCHYEIIKKYDYWSKRRLYSFTIEEECANPSVVNSVGENVINGRGTIHKY